MIESLEVTPVSEERLHRLQLLWLARLLTLLGGGHTGPLTVGQDLWSVSVTGAPGLELAVCASRDCRISGEGRVLDVIIGRRLVWTRSLRCCCVDVWVRRI